jgi:hypothetical protein
MIGIACSTMSPPATRCSRAVAVWLMGTRSYAARTHGTDRDRFDSGVALGSRDSKSVDVEVATQTT